MKKIQVHLWNLIEFNHLIIWSFTSFISFAIFLIRILTSSKVENSNVLKVSEKKMTSLRYYFLTASFLFLSGNFISVYSYDLTSIFSSQTRKLLLSTSIFPLLIVILLIYISFLRKRLRLAKSINERTLSEKSVLNTNTKSNSTIEASCDVIDYIDDLVVPDKFIDLNGLSNDTNTISAQGIEEFERFFFVALDLLCVMDLDGRFKRVNKQWELIFGYFDNVLQNTLFFDYVYDEDLTTTKVFIASLEKHSEIANFTNRYRASDNSYRWLEWRFTRVGDILYAAARDITERKHDEDTLHELVKVTVKTPREGFFDSILEWLRLWLDADLCLICEINEQTSVRVIASSGLSKLPIVINNIDEEPIISLTIQNSFCHYADGIDVVCPESPLVKSNYARGYAGISLCDKNGIAKGVLCIFSRSTLVLPSLSHEVFQIIAVRTISEMEHFQAEARYSSILNTVMDCFALLDNTGKFVDVNEAYCRLIGYSKKELMEKTIDDIDVTNHDYTIAQRMPHLNDNFYDRFETQHVHRDGTIIDLEISINFLPYERGRFVMFLRDITKRKKTEAEIKDITERFTLATRAASMGIWDWDIEKDIIVWNDQMLILYGKDSKETYITFETWKSSLHPEDVERTLFEIDLALKGIKEFDTEFRVVLPDNSTKHVKVISKVSKTSSGKPIRMIGTNWDITIEKETQREFRNAIDEADRANRSKSEFIANMSHEIRTPLNAIIGFSELLESLSTDTKQKQYVSSIFTAGRSLLRIINDILDMSKIESGMMRVQSNPTELYPILEEIRQIFSPRLDEKGLQFKLQIDPFLKKVLYIDEIRLRQVLLNLVGNAVKFTDSGFISITVQPLELKDSSNELVDILIKIEDTGIGIPKDEQTVIFEPFRQRTGQNSAKYGGTGLGLSISRNLTALMNGELSVISDSGKGATFTLKLHDVRYIPSQNSITDQTNASNHDTVFFERSTVLIADDIESNRLMIKEHLVNAGLEVIEVDNGLSAVEVALEKVPQIIIMDLRMPIMDGTTAMIKIRSEQLTKNIPIIALSAAANQNKIDQETLFDFSEYLCKPIERDRLMSSLAKYLPIVVKKNKLNQMHTKVELTSETKKLFKIDFELKLNRFSGAIRIQSVRSLIGELQLFTAKHFSKEISTIAVKLEKAVETFDIEKINLLLKELIDLCE